MSHDLLREQQDRRVAEVSYNQSLTSNFHERRCIVALHRSFLTPVVERQISDRSIERSVRLRIHETRSHIGAWRPDLYWT